MDAGKPRKIFFGLLLGFMVGGGGAVFRERMNTSIRRKDEMEDSLHLPSLAIIPQVRATPVTVRRLPWNTRKGRSNGGRALEPTNDLVTLSEMRSSGAEAYRTLRTNLLFSQSLEALRTLVVTSASPSEGKTTTAANLAVTYAQQGMNVLLVECDLRKPRLHAVFGIKQDPGLTQVIMGTIPVADAIRGTPVENLSVLPSGPLPPNPAEFLGAERMGALLKVLAQDFDMVILDTPPLLVASDAAVLASRSDGVIVVIRAGQTERADAQAPVQQLHAVGAHVVGAVLNDPDAKVPHYGGGYYRYSYYGD